LSLVTNCIISC